MLADKEKPAENTVCILKGFDAVGGHFRPAEPHVFLPVDGKLGPQTCERSECAAASRIFSKRSLAKQGSFLMYQHHSRLWGLFFTGGV